MAEPRFKVGDVVMLKSGGRIMTVVEVDVEEDEIHCQWSSGSSDGKTSGRDCYPEDSLKLYEEPQDPFA